MKGSKNKKTVEAVPIITEEIRIMISTAKGKLAQLNEVVKSTKDEIKELKKKLVETEAAEAGAKAEADKQRILEAIAASGKSVKEIIELIGK